MSQSQIELHQRIDKILLKGPNEVSIDELSHLILNNADGLNYFFKGADSNWLTWLWENDFLENLKKKSSNPNQYGYSTPEINYFVNAAKGEPEKATNIMLDIPISAENFNPEAIDRFLQITAELPEDQMMRMASKISKENWIRLMSNFAHWGFDFEKIIGRMLKAGSYEELLMLSKSILSIKKSTKKKSDAASNRLFDDDPFYFRNLHHIKFFEQLSDVDDEHLDGMIKLLGKVLKQIVEFQNRENTSQVFDFSDTFALLSTDFFELELGEDKQLSYQDNIQELMALIKFLLKRLIAKDSDQVSKINEVYHKFVDAMPENQAIWRFKLFILSLSPHSLRDEIKQALFRLFEVKRYSEIISGTEYEKCLAHTFGALPNENRRIYIEKIIDYFGKKLDDKKRQDWHLRDGSRLLSMISDWLTESERKILKQKGFVLNKDYQPQAAIGAIKGGFISPRAPIEQDKFNKLRIDEISEMLKGSWNPKELSKNNTSEDFLRPINAEGIGKQLQSDILERPQDYINNALLFFDREILDSHYTSSFLSGIDDLLGKKLPDSGDHLDFDNLVALMLEIRNSGQKRAFDSSKRDSGDFGEWLASWNLVHTEMSDLIQKLLSKDQGFSDDNFIKNRGKILQIIEYLLSYLDPIPADEVLETAKSKTKVQNSDDFVISDPFTIALNTVRGRAFKAFTFFVYRDERQFDSGSVSKIAPDIKMLYQSLLAKENTRAIMFMFGHYLPSFYYRDKGWISELLPRIFPTEAEKSHLYSAAWEGFLVNNLYEDLFFDPAVQKLYDRGLELKTDPSLRQRHFKDPNESVAEHIALAFMHYDSFNFEHSLFKKFWENNAERQAKFVSFIGRSFISGSNVKAGELIQKNLKTREKLIDFWQWALSKLKGVDLFNQFGLWINLEKKIYEPTWLAEKVRMTLELTGGKLDWEIGLVDSIENFGNRSPENTLEILRLYLLEGVIRKNFNRMPFQLPQEIIEAFKSLIINSSTHQKAYELIDDLIREGGSPFWPLKDILN